MTFVLDHTRAPTDPPALEDDERGARRAFDEAARAIEVKEEMTSQLTREMSSQHLHGPNLHARGIASRTHVTLPRQRRPLHEHEDPEKTFMEEFEVRRTRRLRNSASNRGQQHNIRVHVDVN
jgi:hypothetical protein